MLYNHFTEATFYIYFLICNKTKNKQLPISKLLALNFSFYLFTPTIDKEPFCCRMQLSTFVTIKSCNPISFSVK